MLSRCFYSVKKAVHWFSKQFIYPKSFILKGNARIGIHHLTNLTLQNSKIIVHDGTFKVGIDYGYYDGGMFDSQRDVCRIQLINSTLSIYGDVSLYPGVQLYAKDAEIIIRNGAKINGPSQIIALNRIEIGENGYIAQGVIVRDNDGHRISTGESTPEMKCLPVKIGNHCWLGQRVMVLKGSTIGDNCVVAAGAVVTKDMDAGTLSGGMPAKMIYNDIHWAD